MTNVVVAILSHNQIKMFFFFTNDDEEEEQSVMSMKEKGRVKENTRDEMEEDKAEKTDNRFTMTQSRKRRVRRAEEKKKTHSLRMKRGKR